MGSLMLGELGSLRGIPRRDGPWGIRPEFSPVADWGIGHLNMGDMAADLAAKWGRPQSWFTMVSELQTDIVKAGGRAGAVKDSAWYLVSSSFQAGMKSGRITSFKTFMATKEAMKSTSINAFERLVISMSRRPSDADIAMSRNDLAFLLDNLKKFDYEADRALGDEVSEVKAMQSSLSGQIAKGLEKSALKSPEEEGIRDGLKHIKGGLGIGALILAGAAVIGGAILLK